MEADKLDVARKTLEAAKRLNKPLVLELARCDFVGRRENLLPVGGPRFQLMVHDEPQPDTVPCTLPSSDQVRWSVPTVAVTGKFRNPGLP